MDLLQSMAGAHGNTPMGVVFHPALVEAVNMTLSTKI